MNNFKKILTAYGKIFLTPRRPLYRGASIIFIVLFVALPFAVLDSATVREMDREAQEYFNNRDYSRAITLWLGALEIEPENERIHQKIQEVYDRKVQKDFAFQKSRLNYRIARKQLAGDSDREVEMGITVGNKSIKDYQFAYKIEPGDNEIKEMLEPMKLLELEIMAAQERLRMSMAKRQKIEDLKKLARTEMALEYPDYQKALGLWNEILSYVPKDSEALEGQRKCQFAIDNRLKFERIRSYMARGKELFDKTDYKSAKREFEEVLGIDPRHREAKDYIEKINEFLEEKQLYAQRQEQAENFYRSGINNVNNYRFDAAVDDFESVLALVKDYKDARARLKDIDRLRREFEQKERAAKLQLINQKFQQGLFAYNEGKYKEAVDAFVVTLSLDRKNELAGEYLKRARDALRLEEEETVDENSPYYNIINTYIIEGRDLFNRGDYAASRKKWKMILEIFPKNKIAREYIINCEIRINPDNKATVVAANVLEARKSLEKKDFRGALKIFNIIKSIDRNYPGIDNLIADATNGLKQAARENLPPADKAGIEALMKLALNYYQKGGRDNLQQALAQFRRVVAMDPNNNQAVLQLNRIETQLRIGVGGDERRQMLTPLQREQVNKFLNNGIYYYTQNNYQKAIAEWQRVLQIDPRNVRALNNIQKAFALLKR